MNQLILTPDIQNCQKHNEPLAFYYSDPNKKACCSICMEEKTGMISAQTYIQKLNAIVQQETESYHNNNQMLSDWFNEIQNYKKNLNTSLDLILKLIADQMKIIRRNKEELQQINQLSTDHQRTVVDLEIKFEITQTKLKQVINQVKEQLNDFKIKQLNNADELLNLSVIKGSTCCKKEENTCFAFAFNKQSNILVVACEDEIMIYQFNGASAKEIQRLTDHTDSIFCLDFMKQSDSFVSGSKDKQIVIWEFDQNKLKWFTQYKLKDHIDSVYCILVNKQDDLLISGSLDKTIKFWKKNNSNWTIQQIFEANDEVYNISLNENENKLLFCLYKKVQIIEKESDSIWRLVQTINIDCYRLCFTVGDQFIFQTHQSDKMEVYDYDHSNKQFQKLQKVQSCKCWYADSLLFPCQYIQKLKIVAVKHCKYLNIFKINSNGKYQLIKTLEFESDEFYGKLSHDGNYLVTWDPTSEYIQVSNLKFIE